MSIISPGHHYNSDIIKYSYELGYHFVQKCCCCYYYCYYTYLLHGAESLLRSCLVLQLIKKFPTFYGARKFITVLTSVRHLSLS